MFAELAGLSAHKAAEKLNSRNGNTRRGQMVRKDGAASAGGSCCNVPPRRHAVKLGGVRSTELTDETRAMGRSVIVKRVTDKAADYAPVIREMQVSGVTSCWRHRRGTQ
jgi:hypothetical protein